MSQHAFESIALILIVLAIGLFILGAGLANAAAKPRPPMYAVPASHPQTPARATNPTDPELCMVITCTNPWTVPIHGWKVCAKHDHRAPYDRTIDPELVSEEAEQWLRRSAS
jgi:hypothetical protein